MPDHGREPCLPCESGKKERRRIQGVRRFSRAAVFNVERTSTTSHPCFVKNLGPSDNAGYTVKDVLASGTTYVSSTGGCANASGTVTCTSSGLANGVTDTYCNSNANHYSNPDGNAYLYSYAYTDS